MNSNEDFSFNSQKQLITKPKFSGPTRTNTVYDESFSLNTPNKIKENVVKENQNVTK